MDLFIDYTLLNTGTAHPVSALYTKEQEAEGQELVLSITNVLERPVSITWDASSEAVSDTNYHFALCFPGGLLDNPDTIAPTIPPEAGTWTSLYKVDVLGNDCYYFLLNSGNASLAAGESLTITFGGIQVDPNGDTRSTTTSATA